MIFTETEDYYHVVSSVFRKDKDFLYRYHFCSPSPLKECIQHTVTDLLRSSCNTKIYSVLDNSSIIAYIAFNSDTKTIESFALRIEQRSRMVDFISKCIEFLGSPLLITTCSVNARDIKSLEGMGARLHGKNHMDSTITFKL